MVETVPPVPLPVPLPPPPCQIWREQLTSGTNQSPSEYRFLQKYMVETMDGDHRHHDGMSTFLPAFLGLLY